MCSSNENKLFLAAASTQCDVLFSEIFSTAKYYGLKVTHTSYKMHENRCVLLKSDMYVRPMQFTVLCTLTALIKPN